MTSVFTDFHPFITLHFENPLSVHPKYNTAHSFCQYFFQQIVVQQPCCQQRHNIWDSTCLYFTDILVCIQIRIACFFYCLAGFGMQFPAHFQRAGEGRRFPRVAVAPPALPYPGLVSRALSARFRACYIIIPKTLSAPLP